MSDPFNSNTFYLQQEQQVQRHEIARLQQVIQEMEWHYKNMHQRVFWLSQTLSDEASIKEYGDSLLTLNQTANALKQHYEALNKMMQLADFNFNKNISDHCKREIYHLYHAGRYTQADLAHHYGISQSAVSKIVNGLPPQPLQGVNPNAMV